MRYWMYTLAIFFFSCTSDTTSDMNAPDVIYHNADIYTVDESRPQAEAIAIKGDTILAVGQNSTILSKSGPQTKLIDLDGAFMMPGFIEGHGHFKFIGEGMIELNFLKDTSWAQIVDKVAAKAKKTPKGEWIIGRGWHQEKWKTGIDNPIEGYPQHDRLSELTPDHPVILSHASGHGTFANERAMEIAGVTVETADPAGGRIVRNRAGEPIGVFEERAEYLIDGVYQRWIKEQSEEKRYAYWRESVDSAQVECLRKGITSFQDAGSSYSDIERYGAMAEDGSLDLRLWVMLRHPLNEMQGNMDGFPVDYIGDHRFCCKAIKSEVDGALGSYGAWLLEPYTDKPHFHGQNTTEISDVEGIADIALEHNMQLCIHAIGDRANREVLNIMKNRYAQSDNKDLRWRIEHAQHMHPDDIPMLSEIGVIPSMQGVHCTSDAPFVEKRLGEERARKGAYAWRSMIESGSIIANGTDAPVEDVDPIINYYASVTRKRVDNGMEFFTEQRMTREEAIKSYTIWNAIAAFEEDLKGSLTPGKLADMTVLSNNLLSCTDEEILETKVLMTIVGGTAQYSVLDTEY